MTDADYAPEGFTNETWVAYTQHWTNFAILLAATLATLGAAIVAMQDVTPVMSQPSPNTLRLHEDNAMRLILVFWLMLIFLEVGGWAGIELQHAHDVKHDAVAEGEA